MFTLHKNIHVCAKTTLRRYLNIFYLVFFFLTFFPPNIISICFGQYCSAIYRYVCFMFIYLYTYMYNIIILLIQKKKLKSRLITKHRLRRVFFDDSYITSVSLNFRRQLFYYLFVHTSAASYCTFAVSASSALIVYYLYT